MYDKGGRIIHKHPNGDVEIWYRVENAPRERVFFAIKAPAVREDAPYSAPVAEGGERRRSLGPSWQNGDETAALPVASESECMSGDALPSRCFRVREWDPSWRARVLRFADERDAARLEQEYRRIHSALGASALTASTLHALRSSTVEFRSELTRCLERGAATPGAKEEDPDAENALAVLAYWVDVADAVTHWLATIERTSSFYL